MMATIAQSPPDVPDLEAFKAGRPASGAAAHSLAASPGHVLGLRGIRAHSMTVQIGDWTTQDQNAGTSRVQYMPFRSSPLAQSVAVVVWYAAGPDSLPGSITVALTKDTAPTTPLASYTSTTSGTMPAGGRAAVTSLGNVPSVGLVYGREVPDLSGWAPAQSGEIGTLTLAGDAATDMWVQVTYVRCIVTAISVIELPEVVVA